jgi:hypothetical protein
MAKRCPISTVTQTVIFPRAYGVPRAKKWLRKHKLKASKVDYEANTIRFRQISPKSCRGGEFASIPMGKTSIRKIICCPKAKRRKAKRKARR